MIINYIKAIIIPVLLLFVCNEVAAQVTIGGNKQPEKGALLELAGNNKGLLLPRVKLSSITKLEPTGVTETWDEQRHVGLWVYNVADDTNDICEGPYVWDGAKWNRLWGSCSGTFFCEFDATGSNAVIYHIYCQDELDVDYADAIATAGIMENTLESNTYAYHLMRVDEFIQTWEKNKDSTTEKAFPASETFFVILKSDITDPKGWITTAKKAADGLSSEITAYGTVAPNGVFSQIFPGGTPIGGEYTTATVRGFRD